MKQYTIPCYRVALVRDGSEKSPKRIIGCAEDAGALCREITANEPNEVMIAIWLDAKSAMIGYEVFAHGGLTQCAVEPRQFLRGALLSNARAMIIAHNHPSGDPTPSVEDYGFAKTARAACRLIGVELIDSIVIAHGTEIVGTCL